MKIGACYIRVSTADQVEYSPESQLRMIKDYATKNDIVIPEEHIYRDEGISGRTAEKRPDFQRMIAAAKQKIFAVILIYSTSRFARNHEQSIVYRSMLERECGVELISITQPNVDKKTDMLTNAIYSIMDEWYSLDLSDNVRRGMTQKAMQGGYQTLPPFGYELKHKGEVMVINEEEARIVRRIFEGFLSGKSNWAISRELKDCGIKTKRGNSLSTRNITYILRNPAYKGYSRWTPTGKVFWDFKNKDTIIAKGKHEAIVDERLFDEVQEKLDTREQITRAKSRPQESMKHWLSGLIKCPNCGQTLNYNGTTPKRKNPCFRCGGYGRGICDTMNFITVADAEKNVLDYFAKIYSNINVLYGADIFKQEIDQHQVAQINLEIKRIKSKLERAKQGYLNELFDLEEFKKIKSSCEAEIGRLQKNVSALNKEEIDYALLQRDISNVYDVLGNDRFGKSEKQAALRSVVRQIIFNKKAREFRVYFWR